jgi:ADP-ribose pyrophosphatase YjhB (NUDIX family)
MSEPTFIPKPGQVDYTDIRYAPVLDVVVTRNGKILLAKRSADRRLYPDCWATIDGFLDDKEDVETKALEELSEELGMDSADVVELKRGNVILHEDPDHAKTWLVVPVLAKVKTDTFTLDWESSEARWFEPKDIPGLDLLSGTLDVIGQFFPEVLQS